MKVLIDLDDDGLADDETWTDGSGSFSYLPLGLADGVVKIAARTSRFDAESGADVYSDWLSLEFTYESPDLPGVQSLRLANDDGDEIDDRVSSSTGIVGQLTDIDVSSPSFLTIEFDHDGDDEVDGTADVAGNGSFSYFPAGLATGDHTIRSRTTRWDENAQGDVVSDWVSYDFTYVLPVNDLISVDELELANDTGDADGITTDAEIVGQLINEDGSIAYQVVEFDIDGDGAVDDSVSSSVAGSFTYSPTLAPGSYTISARGTEWNAVTRTVDAGAWSSLQFTVEEIVDDPPTLSDFSLLSDTGISDTDNVTANSTLYGHVSDDHSSGPWIVEVDTNNDGVVDEQVFTETDGRVAFDPEFDTAGSYTVRARAMEWDFELHTPFYGSWEEISFTLEDQPDVPPTIALLELANQTGEDDTTDPTVSIAISNERSVSNLTLEMDVDEDGVVDQSVSTNMFGEARLLPLGLSAGEVTLNVRVREFDVTDGSVQQSNWSSLNFTYAQTQNLPPEVELNLAEDTGDSDADSVTHNASVLGTVSNDGDVFGMAIEFDHDGDGVVDGTTFTNTEGAYEYMPHGLEPGDHTIFARAKEYDANSQVQHSDWAELDFTLETAPQGGIRLQSLSLANDSGDSDTDASTDDASISGVVQGGLGVSVELDLDGDGVRDAVVPSAEDGSFSFTPSNMDEGYVTVRARAVGASDQEWTALRFVYSTDPDGAEAQQTISDYDAFESARSEAEDDYRAAIQQAQTDYRTAIQDATETRDDAVALAGSDHEDVINSARSDFTDSMAQADRDFAAAISSARSSYQQNLNSFAGDSTTFDLPDFVWPQAPPADEFQVPKDGSQPAPPVPPSYSGPLPNLGMDVQLVGEQTCGPCVKGCRVIR